ILAKALRERSTGTAPIRIGSGKSRTRLTSLTTIACIRGVMRFSPAWVHDSGWLYHRQSKQDAAAAIRRRSKGGADCWRWIGSSIRSLPLQPGMGFAQKVGNVQEAGCEVCKGQALGAQQGGE